MNAGRRELVAALLTAVAPALLSATPQQAQPQPAPSAQAQDAEGQSKFALVASANAACETLIATRPKMHLKALPAKLVTPPRTREGWPDLQGEWSSRNYHGNGIHSIEVGLDPAGDVLQCQETEVTNLLVDPLNGMIPYQPWAQAKRMEKLAGIYAPTRRIDTDTDVRCQPRGIPHDLGGGGFRLQYSQGEVFIFSEGAPGNFTRVVPMDGRPHLNSDIKLMMGDSRGHWDGNTLVVETTNNSDATWFDKHGTFHSDAMKVTERFTLVTEKTMYYEATIDDPTVFTQPWKMSLTFDRDPYNTNTREPACHEGERSVDNTVRAGIRARAAGLHGYHIHVDLKTGKAIRPEEQKYLDESGQPLGHSYAPAVPDSAASPAK